MVKKRTMGRISALFIALGLLAACTKENVQVDLSLINHYGWHEDYKDYGVVITDQNTSWYFDTSSETFPFVDSPGNLMIGYYDHKSGNAARNDYAYSIQRGNPNTITIDWGTYSETYDILKLTSSEMEWQKTGTTFSRETIGTDFLHFIIISSED